jgi:periplasmic nitrate reductase NapD
VSGERHISSLLVLHRPDAAPVLEAFAHRCEELEIAARAESRCVVLCETDHQRALLDVIDALDALPGVINVSLIYHHAESREAMDELIG